MLRVIRISWIVVVVLLYGIASASCLAKPRNVLLLLCHDMNQRIGPYASRFPDDSVAITPAINRLAAQSIVFERAYCQSPIGEASRLSLLSGLYPESTGVIGGSDRIRERCPDAPSLAGYLKSKGYWTASCGKVYPRAVDDGDKLNWDAVVRLPDEELPVAKRAREQFIKQYGQFGDAAVRGRWRKTLAELCTQTRGQRTPGYGPSGLDDNGHADGLNARWAADLIERRAWGSQPFLIAVGIQKPHVPFVVPHRYFDLYDPESLLLSPQSPRAPDSASEFAHLEALPCFRF